MDKVTAILKFVLICVEVVVLFNFIILVHELGHFLAARGRGLVVDRFSIWFGKPIWQKKVGNVVYSLGWIPAGGFVSLPQMAPMEWLEGRALDNGEPLCPATPLDKIIVALAGPIFSFGLAFMFATLVWLIGRPVSEAELTTVIGYVGTNSPAERAGLRPGDKILSVDGHPVSRFGGVGDSVSWWVVASEGRTVRVEYERFGQRFVTEAEPTKDPVKGWQRDNLRQIKFEPAETPMIGEVTKGSPAARAGLRPNDLITGIDGQHVFHRGSIVDHLHSNGTKPVELTVERDGQSLTVAVTPEFAVSGATEKVPRLGVIWDSTGKLVMSHPRPWEQISGVLENMANMFHALTSSKSDIKAQHLSGPVGILRIYYLVFENEHAWRMALWFSVLLNVNLALLNLLPVPMLDGGHIMLSLAEFIRRRPLSEPVVRWVQTCGAVVVVSFVLYVSSFDLLDLRGSHKPSTKDEPIRFAPVPSASPAPAK